jgi:hypothetical protein
MMLALVASSAFFNLPIFCRPLSGGSFPLKIAQLDEKDRALCVRMSGRAIKNYKILQ